MTNDQSDEAPKLTEYKVSARTGKHWVEIVVTREFLTDAVAPGVAIVRQLDRALERIESETPPADVAYAEAVDDGGSDTPG